MADFGLDSHQPGAHDNDDILDLVFIGSGASASYTVLELLGRLNARPGGHPVKIAIVERVLDQFGGLPYGRRSGFTSLIITSLRDFLPPSELANFAQWLAANKASVFDEFLSVGGQLSQAWWARHRDELANDEWDELYVPRYVFGRYLTDRVTTAIEHAHETGTAEVRLIHDEICGITPSAGNDSGYVLHGVHGDLQANRVVLTLGTPPPLSRLDGFDVPRHVVLIDDLFEPSITANLARVVAAASDANAPERPMHVLVIGGNASTMEVIYQLADVASGRLQGASISVVTPRGELPERLVPAGASANFVARSLEALRGSDGITARAICEAGVADTERAHRDGLTVSDVLVATGPLVGALVKRLTRDESEEWAGSWGMQLGRFQRRAGPEYCDVVDELTAGGRLHFIAGAFSGIAADGRITFVGSDGVPQRSNTPFDAVINCSGFTTLSQLGVDSLLGSLLDKGLISTTRWDRGIAVDDSLAAGPGMYVMGPLLAGNVIASGAIWHMEHCGRIISYAAVLAETLASVLTAP